MKKVFSIFAIVLFMGSSVNLNASDLEDTDCHQYAQAATEIEMDYFFGQGEWISASTQNSIYNYYRGYCDGVVATGGTPLLPVIVG